MSSSHTRRDVKLRLDQAVNEARALYPFSRPSYGGVFMLGEPCNGTNWRIGKLEVAGTGDQVAFEQAIGEIHVEMPIIEDAKRMP